MVGAEQEIQENVYSGEKIRSFMVEAKEVIEKYFEGKITLDEYLRFFIKEDGIPLRTKITIAQTLF